ncbi:MAG: GTPase Era [Eubacteriales bacterium]|jgi:GTP-binding protein Era|nr:GTPase Era [Eubacteriales bacterium]MDD4104726.1 GTPase Era [Eubacteriales bacterium]MDD4710306.1 GTPase Era [Eubacteriales bacterium]NLO15297.1 GTPase Era [Clostridiales bacterium]
MSTHEKAVFRSGFVAVIGRPNVGKSTLLNALVGEKVAIVSPKPQTTRSRIMGVVNAENAQLVLLDTPGIHKAKTRLGEYMLSAVEDAMQGIDALCIMVDTTDVRQADHLVAEGYVNDKIPCFLLLNKIDLVHPQELLKIIDGFSKNAFRAILPVSARTGDGMGILMDELVKVMPEGPKYFPDDMMTDQPERLICAELIREKALMYLMEEVPHGIGIEILQIKKENERFTEIHANVYCEKDSHKRIIIGKQGQMLKKIGSAARVEIETLLGTHVNLNLWVKVRPGWRDSASELRTLGYTGQ